MKYIIALLLLGVASIAHAATTLVGLSTDGTVYEIDPSTGSLTQKVREDISDFSLGGIARKQNTLYYVAKPSGSSENAIYTADLSGATIAHADLDRNDSVRALFLQGQKLYGIFYDGSGSTAGLYQINTTTGVTTLVNDLSGLDLEPIGGAFARIGRFYFMLAKPESDANARRLVRFRLRQNSATVFTVADKVGTPVLCDRLKLNLARLNFFCLASPTTTQVDTYRLGLNGRAKLLTTLSDVERIAGGHSLVTPNARTYQALVYAPGDDDHQRLLTLTAGGALKSTVTINAIIVGMRYGADEPAGSL